MSNGNSSRQAPDFSPRVNGSRSTTPERVVNDCSKAAGFTPAGDCSKAAGFIPAGDCSKAAPFTGAVDTEGEDTSLSDTDRAVPITELRKVYKEMKKWKEKYRALKAQDALLAEKDAKIEELRSLISETRIDRALIDCAKEHSAIDPQQVAQFLKTSVTLADDLSACIVDSDGNERSSEGKPFTIDDLVNEFLRAHPHHKKASSASGSGSSRPPVALGANLLDRIKNAQSQKELEKLVASSE